MRTSRRRIALGLVALVLVPLAALLAFGWPASRHPTVAARLGVVRGARAMESVLDTPGPIAVETLVNGTWSVDRSGLVNLDHPAARAARYTDALEPIEIYAHVLRHPTRGVFLVDTGVDTALRDAPARSPLHGLAAQAAHTERMAFRTMTGDWIRAQPSPPTGVFFTHLHLDHVLGARDVPHGVPLYAGEGELAWRAAENLFTQPITDEALAGHGPVQLLPFRADPDGVFEGVLDVFGDGSLWALRVPGHTPGSLALVARTPDGPVLFTGDTCHTAWGWTHGVEPGGFTHDHARNAASLRALRALAARHPRMIVRLGHQRLDAR